ncbi:SUKH-3 domain-containing protein [Hymenobacter sp. B81]|uniref:SUKH-3 domain-containing protein n=1 Tax=Hymenobacter sp. B81 TaxID=3344878 RepID=UPI0037DD124D
MFTFSDATAAVLAAAGWHPGRSIITLYYRLSLWLAGYPWLLAVEQFLREYGGLRLTFPSKSARTDTLHLNPNQAAAGRDACWIRENYARRLGNHLLCPIGEAYTDHLILFMDDAGKVYGGYDEFLCFIADSGAAALEAICQGQPMPEIPE